MAEVKQPTHFHSYKQINKKTWREGGDVVRHSHFTHHHPEAPDVTAEPRAAERGWKGHVF